MTKLAKGDVLKRIRDVGLIPVMRSRSKDLVRRAVAAIRQGGVTVVEITMTVPGAVDVIGELRSSLGDEMLVGAGTVLTAEAATQCIKAGAQFIVSPCTDEAVIAASRAADVVVMPGALTPTEIVHAWSFGADIVKVFPADAMGGAPYLKALKGPLPHIKLVPTGGVTLKTAASFLDAGAEAVGVGGDLVDFAALEHGRDDELVSRAQEFVAIVRRAREAKAHA